MKRVLSYGLLITVLLMYVTATVGFGVHICHDHGSVQAMLLTRGTCCDHGHAHAQAQNPSQACCQSHNHELSHPEHARSECCTASEGAHCCAQGDGCEVSVYVLGADQDVAPKVSLSLPFMACLAELSDQMAYPPSDLHAADIYWSDPPPLLAPTAFLLPLRL